MVSWATYSYFVAAIVGRQHVQPENNTGEVDMYIPIFTLLEVIILCNTCYYKYICYTYLDLTAAHRSI